VGGQKFSFFLSHALQCKAETGTTMYDVGTETGKNDGDEIIAIVGGIIIVFSVEYTYPE